MDVEKVVSGVVLLKNVRDQKKSFMVREFQKLESVDILEPIQVFTIDERKFIVLKGIDTLK